MIFMLTVLVLNFNSGQAWKRTLKGLLINKKFYKKVLIIDGFSRDKSGEKLCKELEKYNIAVQLFKREPLGANDALRFGVKLIETDYFIANNSGDMMLSLPSLKPTRIKNTIFWGACEVRDSNKKLYDFKENKLVSIVYRMPRINLNSIIWPTNKIKKFSVLNVEYKVADDYAILLEAYNRKLNFKFDSRIKSIFYADGKTSDRKILSFGRGELFYIAFNFGSPILATIYSLALLITFKADLKMFLSGLRNAFLTNKR
jgi:isoleucyl-tRNA synthetase